MMVLDLRHLLQPANAASSVIRNRTPALVPQKRRFRVFFHRNGYVCGVCGKAYASSQLAWVCVAACATVEMESLHLEERVSGEREVYACPMCLKVFVNRQDAVVCFEHCRDAALAHLPAEAMRLAVVCNPGERPEALRGQELHGKGLSKSAREQAGQAAEDSVSEKEDDALGGLFDLVPVPEGMSLDDLGFAGDDESAGSLEALSTMGNAEGSADWSSGSAVPEADMPDVDFLFTGSIEDNEPKIKRKPGQKPFIREGARYVCTACKSKFFTRQEAEACFYVHPLSDLV